MSSDNGSTALARTETSNERFDAVAREAAAIARSTVIPKEYQGNPGNCLIAMDVAKRMNLPALAVMQHLYVVHGRPAWSAAFMIAAVNQSGRFSPLRFRFSGEGEEYGCHAEAVDKTDGEVLAGTKITRRMVKAEGWNKNPKWTSLEDQMFRYRAASFWARTYAPEISIGFQTTEEVQDAEYRVQPAERASRIAAALDQPDQPAVIQAEPVEDEDGVEWAEGSLPFGGA
jgi:hypothetical protein